MKAILKAISLGGPNPSEYSGLDFWINPEHVGWLSKQGEIMSNWRRRWFVMKQGRMLWFKNPSDVTPTAIPRGVVHVGRCHAVKDAEDVIHKACSFVLLIDGWPIYFVADSEADKEEWITCIESALLQGAAPAPAPAPPPSS